MLWHKRRKFIPIELGVDVKGRVSALLPIPDRRRSFRKRNFSPEVPYAMRRRPEA